MNDAPPGGKLTQVQMYLGAAAAFAHNIDDHYLDRTTPQDGAVSLMRTSLQKARGQGFQAAHILQWWERIEARLAEMKPRECYRPPWNIKETGALQKVSINFARAQRKRKRSIKRSI